MATTVVLPTGTAIHTQRVSHNNVTKPHRHRKPTQYLEYYVPTIASTKTSRQRLTTQYYIPTRRGNHYYETTGIFYDPKYYYNAENTTQWF